MSIFEYNEEQHLKSEWKAVRKESLEEGIRALIEMSLESGSTKQETLKRIMGKIQVSPEKVAACIEKYWH